jgi:hypothetical protein
MDKQNRLAAPTVRLTALVANLFRRENSAPIDAEAFLPFPPKPVYASEEQSIMLLDRYFGTAEENHGD